LSNTESPILSEKLYLKGVKRSELINQSNDTHFILINSISNLFLFSRFTYK